MLRTDNSSSTTPIEIENKKGLQALKEAMFLTVKEGLGKQMGSPYTNVYGHVYACPPDVINCRALYAFACFPFEYPGYTIAVYVNKHDKPSGVRIPSKIAREIIDYMCTHGYIEKGKFETVTTLSKSLKYHRAEKGR